MTATSIPVASAVSTTVSLNPALFDKGLVGKAETYDQLWAYAAAMGWTEKPFHFVLSNWLALQR